MIHRTTCGLAAATLTCVLATGTATQQPAATHEDVAAVESFLFVQNSTAGAFDGERLTLLSVAPTIFFSDRPFRVFGHTQLDAFLEAWTRGPNSFAEDPPNAILSLLGEEQVASCMVELSDPRAVEGGVSYRVTVTGGTIPASFGESSLFIDNEAWAAVGGLAVGHRMARRQDARQVAAYQAGASSAGATAAQTPSYYYNAAPPAVPPPPPPPPPADAKPPASVEDLLGQAAAAMTTYAATTTDQNKEYIQKLAETVKTISADYAKVAK